MMQMTSIATLEGRVAIVTGCGQPDGIGIAIAQSLRSLGAVVATTDRKLKAGQTDQLDELTAKLGLLGVESLALRGDVDNEVDCETLVKTAMSQLGRVDILVNNAAADPGDSRLSILKLTLSEWQRVINVNLSGAFLMSRAVLPFMVNQKWGRIINISSIAALRGLENNSAYSASKAGVLGLTRALAAEGAAFGITANAICPGSIKTRRGRPKATEQGAGHDVAAALEARGRVIPVGRIGHGSDIGRLAAFLSLPASDLITGQSISVDGGSGVILDWRT